MPKTKPPPPPASMMVWTINDPVIENAEVLEREFDDIRSAGFGGVVVYVRCSRYSWNDRPARRALRRISELCRVHSMQYWLGSDPRFVSHQLMKTGRGLEVATFGDRANANVFPHFAPVVDGAFSIRCETQPRHVHTLTDVAIEYHPIGIIRVYAVPTSRGAFDDITVIDITKHAQFFYNARDRYVEAFGQFDPPDSDPWKVVAFFRFRTNHVDFSDSSQMRRYAKMLDRLKNKGIEVDGMIWDEPGFTCTYGTLPYSKSIRKQFKKRTGLSLKKSLWKLALDTTDGSHVAIRNQYYRIVQRRINDAQRESNEHASRLWGKEVVAGIHDTWHFESADMCDMTHGSLDLWQSLRTKSGGFVDLGGVNDLRDPSSDYYANLAAMSVIGASLGRHSKGVFAMNNLWTIGDDGEGWHRSVMEHCVNIMAVFGTRWLAHAYGPAGTIGEERSFLGSPPLPGYPDHSTWSAFPEWNRSLEKHFAVVENGLPTANVLVVYPVESLYALADTRADEAAKAIFRLLLLLVDNHYQVEVLSSELISRMEHAYNATIYPYPEVVNPKMLPLLDENSGDLMYVFGTPNRTESGHAVDRRSRQVARGADDVMLWLDTLKLPNRIEAPPSTWATLTFSQSGSIVTIAPSRHGYSYEGTVRYGGQSLTLEEQTGLTRILFPDEGLPEQI